MPNLQLICHLGMKHLVGKIKRDQVWKFLALGVMNKPKVKYFTGNKERFSGFLG